MIQNLSREKVCAVVLAGGDGTRLQTFAKERIGSSLPKQYLPLIGSGSMLQRTWLRIEQLIPPDKLFTVVARHHLHHRAVVRQLASRCADTVVVQPENKDTAAGILLSLLHLTHRFPDSIVAMFPSDHYIREESWFMRYVRLAAQAVEINPDQIVLLGVAPREPEPNFGYIIHREIIQQPCAVDLFRVAEFIEKPSLPEARHIVQDGGLWNTMVMVFKSATMLQLMRRILPEFYAQFEPIQNALGSPGETQVTEKVYHHLPCRNFSREVIARLVETTSAVAVLPVRNVVWSDWGIPEQILKFIDQTDLSRANALVEKSKSIRRGSLNKKGNEHRQSLRLDSEL